MKLQQNRQQIDAAAASGVSQQLVQLPLPAAEHSNAAGVTVSLTAARQSLQCVEHAP